MKILSYYFTKKTWLIIIDDSIIFSKGFEFYILGEAQYETELTKELFLYKHTQNYNKQPFFSKILDVKLICYELYLVKNSSR